MRRSPDPRVALPVSTHGVARAVLVATSVLVATACAVDVGGAVPGAAARAVVGGVAVHDDAAVGATVSLFFTDMGESGCTGTLIAPRVVATAAHCLACTAGAGSSCSGALARSCAISFGGTG